jgi:hypothetical protein
VAKLVAIMALSAERERDADLDGFASKLTSG